MIVVGGFLFIIGILGYIPFLMVFGLVLMLIGVVQYFKEKKSLVEVSQELQYENEILRRAVEKYQERKEVLENILKDLEWSHTNSDTKKEN